MTQKQLIDIYLDYRNNFLSVDGYASHYGLPYDLAASLIIYSRELYNLTYPQDYTMNMKELNSLSDTLLSLLNSHDRFYEMSEDMSAYCKGRDEKKAILDHMVNRMGYDKKNADQYYSFITQLKKA